MSLNRALRAHQMKFHRQNKLWAMLIDQLTKGKKPKVPLHNACIKITRYAHRTLDFDGLVGSMKSVVDGLVTCGILEDDSWKVTGPWMVTQEFRPKKLGTRLVIEVVQH